MYEMKRNGTESFVSVSKLAVFLWIVFQKTNLLVWEYLFQLGMYIIKHCNPVRIWCMDLKEIEGTSPPLLARVYT